MSHKLPSKKYHKNGKSSKNSKNSSKAQSKNTSFHKPSSGIDNDIKNLEADIIEQNKNTHYNKNMMNKRREKALAKPKISKNSSTAILDKLSPGGNSTPESSKNYSSIHSNDNKNILLKSISDQDDVEKLDKTPKLVKKDSYITSKNARGRTSRVQNPKAPNRRSTKEKELKSKTPPHKKKYTGIHVAKKEKENIKLGGKNKVEIPSYAKPTKSHDNKGRSYKSKLDLSKRNIQKAGPVLTNNVNIYNMSNSQNPVKSKKIDVDYIGVNNLEKARALKRARRMARKKNSASLVASNKDDIMAELDRNLRKVELQMEKPVKKRSNNVQLLKINTEVV